MKIKCSMTSCSNRESFGFQRLGNTSVLDINEKCFYFDGLRSSLIKAILFDENKIIIQTRNTKYTFEKEI